MQIFSRRNHPWKKRGSLILQRSSKFQSKGFLFRQHNNNSLLHFISILPAAGPRTRFRMNPLILNHIFKKIFMRNIFIYFSPSRTRFSMKLLIFNHFPNIHEEYSPTSLLKKHSPAFPFQDSVLISVLRSSQSYKKTIQINSEAWRHFPIKFFI